MVSLILFSCGKSKSTQSFCYLLVSSVCKEVLTTLEEDVEEEKKAEDGMLESIFFVFLGIALDTKYKASRLI